MMFTTDWKVDGCIIFEVFQPMRSGYLIVADRQTTYRGIAR